MDSRYLAVKSVPQSALKPIEFGKLKGKYDISPQWRWEILTETYGMCGIGWYFDIVETKEVLVEATKYAKEQLVMNPPLQHIKVKEAMESILTESERTELSRLLNKLVLGIENIEI